MGQPATTCLLHHFSPPKPSRPDQTLFSLFESTVLGWSLSSPSRWSSNFSERDWNDALSAVSAPKTEGHTKTFRKHCPDNVYISMIAAYPTKWTDKLSTPSDLPKDPSGVQQAETNVNENNFDDIFPGTCGVY
ncbi:hypothetical protein BGX27_001225 [Mortierella sp. AM989]|nr:hypothetical protein BGX27_001225 [Mortierella sp. AM989]